jgi:hypothetical protein
MYTTRSLEADLAGHQTHLKVVKAVARFVVHATGGDPWGPE